VHLKQTTEMIYRIFSEYIIQYDSQPVFDSPKAASPKLENFRRFNFPDFFVRRRMSLWQIQFDEEAHKTTLSQQ
jgi:hypothetical protein